MNIPKDRLYNYDIENGDYMDDYMKDSLEDKLLSKNPQNKIFCPYPDENEENIKLAGEEDNNDFDFEEYGGGD